MILRKLDEIIATERDVLAPNGNWRSRRFLNASDQMGFSLHDTTIFAGTIHRFTGFHPVRGNLNWMKAREAILESDLFTQAEIDMLLPICQEGSSDSSNFDIFAARFHDTAQYIAADPPKSVNRDFHCHFVPPSRKF